MVTGRTRNLHIHVRRRRAVVVALALIVVVLAVPEVVRLGRLKTVILVWQVHRDFLRL